MPGEPFCRKHVQVERQKLRHPPEIPSRDEPIRTVDLGGKYPQMPLQVNADYQKMLTQSPDDLKSVIEELALAKSILQNAQLVFRHMKCQKSKCAGVYICDICGAQVEESNQCEVLDLVDKVTRITERVHKIDKIQKVYVDYIGKALEKYLERFFSLLEQNVTNPIIVRRIAAGMQQLNNEFDEFVCAELGIESPETRSLQ